MKKIWVIIILIFFSVLFSACSNQSFVENTLSIATMDTHIRGTVVAPKSAFQGIQEDLKQMYDKYHKLTDNFKGYEGIKGVYYINKLVEDEKTDQTVEIEKELYDILKLGLEVYELTNGYFDMSIGKIIDIWKEIIFESEFPGTVIPQERIDFALSKVHEIEVIEDAITIKEVEGKYFVTLKYGAKIDLGAIAKGYVTQLAANYLNEKGYHSFLISGGGSSMLLGENNPNPSSVNGTYRIGLIDPYDMIEHIDVLGHREKYYATYASTNFNATTSGSYNQFVIADDVMYHHIVSPVTKKPINHYLTLTVIGEDAGFNDALSTALFNMPPDVLDTFLKENPYEVIVFLPTNTFVTYNQTDNFKAIT